MRMRNAVDIGIKYEKKVLEALQTYGLKAYRTNQTNIHDPKGYKHGFDGGVDIIAEFHTSIKGGRDFTFYIQCKCHNRDLIKTAVSEVYAGMHVRKGFGGSCIPVVIATCGASQETMQYAKELGVELFLQEQADIVIRAKATGKAPYGSYGTFLKVLLYLCTKDTMWIDALPENRNTLSKISMTEQLLMDTKADFDRAQSYLDSADSMERRAREERQKALDIQKAAAYRAIQAGGLADNGRENHTKKEKPTVIEDSG